MQKIYTSDNRLHLYHLKNLLEVAGIACQIRNDNLLGIAGEVPALECWPQLWVLNAIDLARARALLKGNSALTDSEPAWQCACGEQHEAQFVQCWSCGAGRSA